MQLLASKSVSSLSCIFNYFAGRLFKFKYIKNYTICVPTIQHINYQILKNITSLFYPLYTVDQLIISRNAVEV